MECAKRDTQFVLPRARFELCDGVKEVDALLEQNPEDAKLWFRRAQALSEQALMREAVEALSRAIALDPLCGYYYRWRGHRHLNCGDIQDAMADFTLSTRLIPEEWEGWYHLGLCDVVLRRHRAADWVYTQCWKKDLPERLIIPLVNWSYLNLRYLGREDEAAACLTRVHRDMDPGPNVSYLRMVRYYQGELTAQEMMDMARADEEPEYGLTTQGFGLACCLELNGDRAGYEKALDDIIAAGEVKCWNCFGHGAAMYRKRELMQGGN